MRVAGVMSGTSLDGIDVAIVDIDRQKVSPVGWATIPYPAATRARIMAVSDATCTTPQISRLNFELGGLYARAIRRACERAGVAVSSLDLVGCHGQTIYHEGAGKQPNTLQIGEADVIAETLDVPVVSGFRTRDIAAGGLGAPLVPFVDYLLFGGARVNRVALNIGGIANITILPKGAVPSRVRAFDTGPGNMVIDQLVSRMTNGARAFDRNGQMAAAGHVNRSLLHSLLENPWYRQPPPKTAGREQFGAQFVDRLLASGLDQRDLLTTASVLTAVTIAEAIGRYAPGTAEVITSGGGVHNSFLMAQLQAFLPTVRLMTSTEFGVNADAKEAIAFAILAERTWRGLPGNLPSATGARRETILGKISLARHRCLQSGRVRK